MIFFNLLTGFRHGKSSAVHFGVVAKEKLLLFPASPPDPATYQSTMYPSISIHPNAILCNPNPTKIPSSESNNIAVYATNRKGKKMRIMFIRRTAICVLQEGRNWGEKEGRVDHEKFLVGIGN